MRILKDESGAAVLMVVIVLAALTIVAAPFALSMHLHARSARAFKCQTQAKLAAEGALAHAVAQLQRTSDASERAEDALAPFNTPEYDARDELEVDFTFTEKQTVAALKTLGVVFDSTKRGVLWSVEVEDEQGKINLLSAPPELVGNLLGSSVLTERIDRTTNQIPVDDTWDLPSDDDVNTVEGRLCIDREIVSYSHLDDTEIAGVQRAADPSNHRRGSLVYLAGARQIADLPIGRGQMQIHPFRTIYEAKEIISPEEFERIERFITTHSHRESGGGWSRREKILGERIVSTSYSVRVKDNANFGHGTKVRIMDGEELLCTGRVFRTGRMGSRGGSVVLYDEIGLDVSSPDLVIEAEIRHPININTASRRVLVAMFKGVRGISNDSVTQEEAEVVADLIIEKEIIANEDDFRSVLDEARDAKQISWNDRTALLENATVPNSTKLLLSTTTICYKTYGTYTIEASGLVSDPVGNERARYTVREIVSIPDESPGQYNVRSQREFEEQMTTAFGKKVVTWPNPMRDPNVAPDESIEDDDGYVRLVTSEAGTETMGVRAYADHFPRRRGDCRVDPDGARITGASINYRTRNIFDLGQKPVAPGYFEMWVRPIQLRNRSYYFFGTGSEEDRDHIAFFYDGALQELVLQVADSCRDAPGLWAEYRYPYHLEEDEWHHVAAAWKGSQWGQQSIRVDGQALGEGRCDYKPSSRLVGNLGVADDSVLVEETKGFPDAGAVIVDHEIIEYLSKTDGSFEGCRRGTRYSAFAPHDSDAVVRPYGYINKLAMNLVRGGASLASDLGANAVTTIDKPAPPPPTTEPGGIDDIETTIPVADTDSFQESGYVRIDGELIYYGSKSATQLQQCIRGVEGNAVAHKDRRPVALVSLHVTGHAEYPTGGQQYVSLIGTDNQTPEWFGYQHKWSQNGKFYLHPGYRVRNGWYSVTAEFRDALGTAREEHTTSEDVIPVFRVQGPECGNPNSPEGESVTIADKNDVEPTANQITRAHYRMGRGSPPARIWYHEFRVSLRDFVSRTYKPGDNGRVMKFPSGELPSTLPGTTRVAASRSGGGLFRGYVDEVKFTRGTCKSGYIPRDEGITAADDQITVAPFGGGKNIPDRGIAMIGEEFIYYDDTSTGTLTPLRGYNPDRTKKRDDNSGSRRIDVVYLNGCIRGVLGGGKPEKHDEGSHVTFCDEYPVTTLSGNIHSKSETIGLTEGKLFPQQGYALVDTEIISWTKKEGNGRVAGCKEFHGAFGTRPSSHAAGRLVQSLPFRYWDRYAPESDSTDLAYFQMSTTVRDARWQSISWDEEAREGLGAAAPILVRCIVRFDAQPAWDQKPTNEPGGLWEFTRQGVHTFSARSSRRMGVKADQVEARFYFDYRSGCFGRGRHYWKRTPLIDSVTLTYASPLVVRKYDVIDH